MGKDEERGVSSSRYDISAIGIWEALPLILPTIRIQRRFYKLLKKYPPDCHSDYYMGPNINIGLN